MKMFFGYKKYDSVTDMLFTTGLSSFDTVLRNARHSSPGAQALNPVLFDTVFFSVDYNGIGPK